MKSLRSRSFAVARTPARVGGNPSQGVAKAPTDYRAHIQRQAGTYVGHTASEYRDTRVAKGHTRSLRQARAETFAQAQAAAAAWATDPVLREAVKHYL